MAHLGAVKATQPLVIEGGEFRADSVEALDLLIRGGVLRADQGLTLQEGECFRKPDASSKR